MLEACFTGILSWCIYGFVCVCGRGGGDTTDLKVHNWTRSFLSAFPTLFVLERCGVEVGNGGGWAGGNSLGRFAVTVTLDQIGQGLAKVQSRGRASARPWRGGVPDGCKLDLRLQGLTE